MCRKWLFYNLGDDKYRLSTTDHAGNMILSLLKRPPNNHKEGRPHNPENAFTVQITEFTSRYDGVVIDKRRARRFDNWVAGMIKHELYTYVEAAQLYGQKIHRAIHDFLAKYDFTEDELTFSTAKRMYYRKKSALEKKAG